MSNYNFRYNIGPDGAPVQQSLTANYDDYAHVRMGAKPLVGVVWEVYPSDDERNRTARNPARRGFLHECSVVIVDDGSSRTGFIEHVAITPDALTGLDDYYEHLPRPSSQRLSGQAMKPNLSHVNPYDLDGDWCVVSFIGGYIDQPFILKWWPHARNRYDAATSGKGNPTRGGEGKALQQSGRFFRRINGVEYVVTSQGDVYLATTYANSRLQMNERATKGRFARSQRDAGGSIHVAVKPSQSLELSWRTQREGIGIRGGREDELPQTNPRSSNGTEEEDNSSTYIRLDGSDITLEPEEKIVVSTKAVEITAVDGLEVTSNSDVEIDSENTSISVSGVVNLGGTSGRTLITSGWEDAWSTAFGPSTPSLVTGSPAQNAAAIVALETKLKAIQSALSAALTSKTLAE